MIHPDLICTLMSYARCLLVLSYICALGVTSLLGPPSPCADQHTCALEFVHACTVISTLLVVLELLCVQNSLRLSTPADWPGICLFV